LTVKISYIYGIHNRMQSIRIIRNTSLVNIVSSGTMLDEYLEGRGHDLMELMSRHLPVERIRNIRELQSKWPVFRLRLEPNTSQIGA
jgi:hypothetical protein